MTSISKLQQERLKYQPKLPESLLCGINQLTLNEGSKTKSVRDEEKISELFKNTYGKPLITFDKCSTSTESSVRNVGVSGSTVTENSAALPFP